MRTCAIIHPLHLELETARYLKDTLSPSYYIAGPPGMVEGLHTMLTEIGVDDADIRAEEFAGY
jgi:ferredoxin-NADP reductase